jgi:hypothetical protein
VKLRSSRRKCPMSQASACAIDDSVPMGGTLRLFSIFDR